MIQETDYDIIIENGIIVDGTGEHPFKSDVGIREGYIKSIGDLSDVFANLRIDCKNRYVCPGFIDVHNHTDVYSASFPGAEGKIMQGVTTDICGLCGESATPIGKGWLEEYVKRNRNTLFSADYNCFREISFRNYLEETNLRGNTTNMAMFVGNSNLRINAMGYEDKNLSANELEIMKLMLSQAMQEGSYGLSTGLTYVPSMFAQTEEIIELCKVIAPYGGIYNSHMRNEGNEVVESVKEVIEIAQKSGCRGHISHLKVMGKKNHGKSVECLKFIDKANSEGINITFDVYPYTAGSTALSTLLPSWVVSKGFGDDFAVLRDGRESIFEDLQKDNWDNIILSCGYDNIYIGDARGNAKYEGKSITQIANENSISEMDAIFKVLVDSGGHATMIYYAISENDLRQFLKSPYCMIGTDAYARHYEGPTASGKPHPRNYGAFPKYIRKYLLDEKVISIEEGINKITGLAAQTFGIDKRGFIKAGFIADITVFNPKSIREVGNYNIPNIKPEGIDWVFINGRVAVQEGIFKDVRAGRMLRCSIK